MKSWVVDPVTKQRYLLVSTSGAPALMAADQEMLLLRNDQAIMQALAASARDAGLAALQAQLTETQARVALLESQLQDKAEAA
jgi:hypothetical protein